MRYQQVAWITTVDLAGVIFGEMYGQGIVVVVVVHFIVAATS